MTLKFVYKCYVQSEIMGNGTMYQVATNAADLPTRSNSTAKDISPTSPWQKCKAYAYKPREEWPTDRDFADRKEECIPHTEILKRFRGIVNKIDVDVVPRGSKIDELIDPYFTNDWERLIERTVVFLSPFLRRSPFSGTFLREARECHHFPLHSPFLQKGPGGCRFLFFALSPLSPQ